MSPPTIDQFLEEIARILREKNGTQLQEYLIYEPPLPALYNKMVVEIKQVYPASSQNNLENKCISFIPEYEEGVEDGGSRASFISFMVKYFSFLRDSDITDLVTTHDQLKVLLNQSILALGSSIGLVVLPTVISLSQTLTKLAIGLDKRPDLTEKLTRRESTVGGDEAAERVTLVESSANVIREAFKKCLGERSGNATGIENGKPEGRRKGIYLTANLCLKLFFQCRKLRSAEQIFGNIYQQSPPLGIFPASQRVTFLYYLGRYLFANSHFYRAQLSLQAAYDQCHAQGIKQRRIILIYLITSNIILGRFPSSGLLQRPEAAGLFEKFEPICMAIVRGDVASFRRSMDIDSKNADWFIRKRILLQLANRCEILVWRSLARRTFVISGIQGDATNKKAPTLALQDVLILAVFLEKQLLAPFQTNTKVHSLSNGNSDADLMFSIAAQANVDEAADQTHGYIDPDLAGVVDPEPPLLPTMEIIESIFASLIEQDLLHGFISHSQHRFAITGVKNADPLQVGFPRVWDVINARADTEVPGWVREKKANPFGGQLGGMVVNLSGARPAGAAPA